MAETAPLSKQATIVFGLIVVGFMAFGLAISFYRNLLFDESLRVLNEQNSALSDSITDRKRTLLYYQSDQFKDKFAKENLNKVHPGEHVLILYHDPTTFFEDTLQKDVFTEQKKVNFENELRQLPVYMHWKLYFFYPERVEQLKLGI